MILVASATYGGADHADVDRYLGAHFFDTQAGGSAVIVGCTSSGYSGIRKSIFWCCRRSPSPTKLFRSSRARRSSAIRRWWRRRCGIGLISLGVWAHHMFTVGMTSARNTFFVLSTMVIGGADGDQNFQLDRDHVGRQDQVRHAMMFCLAFLFQFLVAG